MILHTRISHVQRASPGTPGARDGSIDAMLYFALSCEAAFGCGLSTSITEAVMCQHARFKHKRLGCGHLTAMYTCVVRRHANLGPVRRFLYACLTAYCALGSGMHLDVFCQSCGSTRSVSYTPATCIPCICVGQAHQCRSSMAQCRRHTVTVHRAMFTPLFLDSVRRLPKLVL